jgi:hypothetical protein
MQFRRFVVLSLVVLIVASGARMVHAASSASFVFVFIDPGDDADGPQYNITGSGVVDDGNGCDEVVMAMVDATGTLTDMDFPCLDLITGLGNDDGDYGSADNAYVPTLGPVTYALYDIDAADIALLGGLPNDDATGLAFLKANGDCLSEQSLEVDGIPNGTAFSLCGGGAPTTTGGLTCGLNIPEGSVVGEAPLGAQIYFEPGNISPGNVLNPGTYIVIGQDKSKTYYKIVLACDFVWVRKDTMQPSYLPPQSGAQLPTRIVD